MGWGKLLGDFAKGYIGERGIEGTMDDLNSIKNGVSKLFGSNDDGYNQEAAQQTYIQDWNQTTDAIYSFENEEEFNKAKDVLDAFYAKYDEGHDFWYDYFQAHIIYRMWGAAYAPLLEDGNTAFYLPDDVEKLRNEVGSWLRKLQSEATEEKEVKAVKDLASAVDDEDGTIYFFLHEHELWFDVNRLVDPNKIVSRSKIRDFNQALSKIKEFYHEGYWRNEGLVRVYISMLRAARDKEKFLKELAPKFDEIKKNTERAVNNLRSSADNDQRQHANDLAGTAMDLLHTVDERLKNASATQKSQPVAQKEQSAPQKPQPAAKPASNAANETEYLEEIKACLADDGTISDRERRILNRLRDSLGISEQRAKELEDSLNKGLTDDEKEFLDALKDSLVDGVISNRERRLLDKLRVSLGVSEARAKELEQSLK
jgi:hypothetical protein